MTTLVEFARDCRVTIPMRLETQGKRIYLDVILQADEMLAKATSNGGNTPVDTGYLRASRAATAGGIMPQPMPPRTSAMVKSKVWISTVTNDTLATASAVAVKSYLPLTLGFRADYAKYMEDRYGMIKAVVMAWPRLVRTAVQNARGAQ